jgi:antitoxin component YwqK of YwqJK toxin-antitoxin module
MRKEVNIKQHQARPLAMAWIVLLWLGCNCGEVETVQVRHFFSNGQLQEQYTVIKGTELKQGLFEEWFNTGEKYREIHYQKNKKDGPYIEYSPFNGKKRTTAFYKNDVLDGTYTEWYWGDDGMKSAEKEYRNGRVGDVKMVWYYASGQKKMEIDYHHKGEKVTKTLWNEQGEQIKQFVWDKQGPQDFGGSVK